jgi:hypothetical protein
VKALVIACTLALLAGRAHAQGADVGALIKLVETQPAGMERPEWKEKRRDAARKLGQSKDKRAVPVLIKIAQTETFDVVGEIAIEGLGNLGDPQAVPVLQKIAADNAREPSQRELAKKALAKLGASEGASDGGATSPPTGGGTGLETGSAGGGTTEAAGGGSDTTTTAPTGGGGGGGVIGEHAEGLPALPVLPDDTIAAYQRLTFAAGTSSFSYDTERKRSAFDVDASGLFAKRIEREKMAWGVDAGAHVVAGMVNPEGRAVSRGLQLDITGTGEARFYSGKIYGVGKAATALHLDYITDLDPNDPNADFKESRLLADFQVALGGGYGRVIDVGGAIRVRRLARTLEGARALGRPIDPATARRLQLTWWALRGERSSYRALVTTVAILREAGILLGEPDAGLTYELLNVLRDTQLYQRPSGLDAQVTFGEGYLRRPENPMGIEHGRVEQLLAQAGYGSQLQDDKLEISGTAYARLAVFSAEGDPSPWAAGAIARMRRFTYGEHGDPYGAFDVAGTLAASNDGGDNSTTGLRISGELGFTYWINQASGLRLAAQVAEDAGELFIGAQLQATYGLLDGTFAR